MSLQLSNGMGLNLWNIFNTANQIPDTSTYQFCTVYENDSTTTVVDTFSLERLKYTYTSDNQKCYDQKWRLTYGNVDLTLTATHVSNEVQLPFRFFEGSMLIEGTVGGAPVTGVGYVELLHSFSNPQVTITSPVGHVGWDGTTPVTWHLNNPDDGRPVYYDLSVSTDNQSTFTPIATHLTDTSYLWTPTLIVGTEGWFRVKAYSIDTTLVSTVTSSNSFIFGVSGIEEIFSPTSVNVFPNPFEKGTTIQFELNSAASAELTITDVNGKVVKQISSTKLSAGKHQFVWNDNSAAGIYFYRLRVNENYLNGKLVKQ
jgi:hypothetical protein